MSLAIASVFIFAMEQFTILVEKNAAEESVLWTTYNLRNYLSQGVDVYAVAAIGNVTFVPPSCPSANSPNCNPSGAGQIDVNFELLVPGTWAGGAGDAGNFGWFAVFNREAARYNASTQTMPTTGSMMQITGIFVRDTNAGGITPDAKSGGIVFDYNSTPPVMVPTASDLGYSRLHNFRVQRLPVADPTCPNGYSVEVVRDDGTLFNCLPAGWTPAVNRHYRMKTITLEVSARYFKSMPKEMWNYRAPVGGAPSASYLDIVQTVKINFKNNVLTTNSPTGGSSEERVHGSVYFYDYFMPTPTL